MSSASGLDLKAIRAGLRAVSADISGISVSAPIGNRAVSDEDQSWVMADPATQAALTFRLISCVGLGEDENRHTFDEDITPEGADEPGALLVNTCGNRKLTFSIKCECYEAEFLAFEYIEKVRSNIARPSVNQTIASFGCSINNIGQARPPFSLTSNGRTVSVVGFDLVLNTVSNLADVPDTTIETFDVQSEVLP
jgi:hypothetical protein